MDYIKGNIIISDGATWKIVAGDSISYIAKRSGVERTFYIKDLVPYTETQKQTTLASSVNSNRASNSYDLSGLAEKSNVLELDNETEFTPTADYHPATKKYVDDEIGGIPVFTPRGQAVYVQENEPDDAEENDIWIDIS